MYCLKCKKVFPDTDKNCPYCGASALPERCPECWAKLSAGEDICSKCGCDFLQHIREKEQQASYVPPTLKDRIKSIPKYIKIGVPSFAAILIFIVVSLIGYIDYSHAAEAKKRSETFVVQADASMDMLTEMAGYYEDEVYNRDWISHIENAAALREKYADKIEAIHNAREPVTYAKDLVAECGNDEISSLADDVYYAYTACYSYVIGEKGKYPHYLDKYNKLLDKYENAVRKLEDAIKKKKGL